MSHPTATTELVRTASQRLVRTVDSLEEDAWPRPSLLPGWTVAHVVAHLALNGEALTAVLVAVAAGRPVTMYPSVEARDDDIADLGAADPAQLRDRLMAAVARVELALTALPEDLRGTRIERTPGSTRTFPAGAVGSMRLREVEIHHADLGVGYSPADWPLEFTTTLLDHGANHWSGAGFRAEAVDLGRTWTFGGEGATVTGPTVRGPAHELAWWSTGRPAYPGTDGPTSDDGVLPGMEAM